MSTKQKLCMLFAIGLILFGVGSMGYFYLYHEPPVTGAKMTRYSLIAGVPMGVGVLIVNLVLMRIGADPGSGR